MSKKKPLSPEIPEEPTGRYQSGEFQIVPEGLEISDSGQTQYLPTLPAAEEPGDLQVPAETPVEEPTRPLSEFDRRAWALLGDAARGDVPAEKPPQSVNEPEELDEREAERDYQPIRTRRDYRLGCLGGMMYAAFVICLSIVLACVGWMAASDVLALNKPVITAEITLSDDLFTEKTVEEKDDEGNVTGSKTVKVADMDAVARLLKDYGLINYKWLFRFYAGFSHAEQKLDPGTYSLSTNYDYRALVKKMQVGSDSQVQTSVTFPEGFTMEQIFARLEEKKVCSKADLYEAAANAEYSYSFLEGIPAGEAKRLEGFLFPDTYYFYEGMQASSAINKFLSNFHYKITAEMIQLMYDRGLTFQQTVTIASIIEAEAANDNERFLIAAVIYNRLAQDMPLQMDSTVLYGSDNPESEVVTGTMLRDESNLYNSYIYKGLPPGPICSPGLASLRAALNPADTNYLYFALDENTGTHQFFLFLNEFQNFLATQSYAQDLVS